MRLCIKQVFRTLSKTVPVYIYTTDDNMSDPSTFAVVLTLKGCRAEDEFFRTGVNDFMYKKKKMVRVD